MNFASIHPLNTEGILCPLCVGGILSLLSDAGLNPFWMPLSEGGKDLRVWGKNVKSW